MSKTHTWTHSFIYSNNWYLINLVTTVWQSGNNTSYSWLSFSWFSSWRYVKICQTPIASTGGRWVPPCWRSWRNPELYMWLSWTSRNTRTTPLWLLWKMLSRSCRFIGLIGRSQRHPSFRPQRVLRWLCKKRSRSGMRKGTPWSPSWRISWAWSRKSRSGSKKYFCTSGSLLWKSTFKKKKKNGLGLLPPQAWDIYKCYSTA